MSLSLHMCIQQRFTHKAHAANKALVWFFITVHEPKHINIYIIINRHFNNQLSDSRSSDLPVRISIIPAVEGLPTNFTQKRLLPRVNPTMFFEMFRVHERRIAHSTLKRSLSRVRRLHVIIQQASPLEPFTARLTLVPFIIVVRRPFMRLQVRPLTERRPTKLTLVRSFARVRPFMVTYFCFARERFTANAAYVRFVAGVHNRVHFEVVR